MKTYVLLLRGINVGGRNVLPMKTLVALLEGYGLRDVKTYIQSCNVVFRGAVKTATHLKGKLGLDIERDHGFKPHVLVLPLGELEKATTHIDTVATARPADADVLKLQARLAAIHGDVDQAIQLMSDARTRAGEKWRSADDEKLQAYRDRAGAEQE